jgi:hypothetical protein
LYVNGVSNKTITGTTDSFCSAVSSVNLSYVAPATPTNTTDYSEYINMAFGAILKKSLREDNKEINK